MGRDEHHVYTRDSDTLYEIKGHLYVICRIQKRRDEAIDRQAKYNTLTINEKIRLAHSRRGNNKRELERLTKTKELSTPAPGIIETKTEKKKGKKVL